MFEDDEPISNETRFLVEQEVKRFLEEALAQANHILKTRENEHHRLAEVTEFLGPLFVPSSNPASRFRSWSPALSLILSFSQALLEHETLTADEMRIVVQGKKLPKIVPEA
jgi:ATP-dependent Zn protease